MEAIIDFQVDHKSQQQWEVAEQRKMLVFNEDEEMQQLHHSKDEDGGGWPLSSTGCLYVNMQLGVVRWTHRESN